ncbi:hypothetical protein E2R51_07780 [Jeotgalibacillus sp. S-D1]|uniref:hypothetical protein n=1 Tax=Jeotgalibacillus sp. S-D1 TaxID=2552189 RepID=UPI00105AA629|nr:hypothetical protein [Jeotgalibacillus sp. S-D1]TDL32576.1 hypothetical protein E2R51_07780 [Jeotgalibacillus sp. S-D1]
MKHYFLLILLFLSLYCLSACDSGEKYQSKGKTEVFGDFKVTVNINEDSQGRTVLGEITYMGKKEEVRIYHRDSPIYFTVRMADGDYEYIETAEGPYQSTVLKRNEPVSINSGLPFLNNLEPAMYEFEAIALISESTDEPMKELKVMRSAVVRD